jgi:hypothetical protein
MKMCSRCGSSKIVEGRLAGPSSVQIGDSHFHFMNHFVPLHALVCGECGDVQLRVEDARRVWERASKDGAR